MRTTLALLAAVLVVGCNCGSQTVTGDAGTDAGGADAGDSGTVATDGGADAGRGLTLPIYRIGPRSAFQGSFAQSGITGSIELPLSGRTPAGFSDWVITSRVGVGTATIMPAADDGGTRRAAFTVDVSTASSAPAQAREIFTATSADGGTVLMTVMRPAGELHFTVESTALQALALHEVRAEEATLEEAYYRGAAPADRPALDSSVLAVAESIRLRLSTDGSSGLSPSGFAMPGSPLFALLDAERASPGVFEPVVTTGESYLNLTEVELSGAEGTLALWAGPRTPQPAIAVPAGTRRVAFFIYSFSPGSDPLYVKFATADGGQSPASASFQLAEPLGVGPDEPTLTFDGGQAEACGLTAGHHVVFFSSSTELAIGFAAVRAVDGGCVALGATAIPAGVALLTAAQVRPDGRVGSPSPAVFP